MKGFLPVARVSGLNVLGTLEIEEYEENIDLYITIHYRLLPRITMRRKYICLGLVFGTIAGLIFLFELI